MTDVHLEEADLAVLIGVVAALEDYLRVDEGDPTARAHALKHVVRRLSADLEHERGLSGPTNAELAEQVHAINARLRRQLTAGNPERG